MGSNRSLSRTLPQIWGGISLQVAITSGMGEEEEFGELEARLGSWESYKIGRTSNLGILKFEILFSGLYSTKASLLKLGFS